MAKQRLRPRAVPGLLPRAILALLTVTAALAAPAAGQLGFQRRPWFGERVRLDRTKEGVRCALNLPARIDPARPTRLVLYATPNGSSLEETLGSERAADQSWRYDIQHAAAQTRRWRELNLRENVVLGCVEAEGKSWPAWRAKHPDNGTLIRQLVDAAVARVPGLVARITLTGHSGGGSFMFGYINGGAAIPDQVDRIAFLDANYAYSDDDHAAKLLSWLNRTPDHRLLVAAYDDRRIMLDGKLVVSPSGGTHRASHRILDRLPKEGAVEEAHDGPRSSYRAIGGRARFWIHENPENKILHTAMVGDWNGLLHVLTVDTPEAERWGRFEPPRVYSPWIQPGAPGEPDPAFGLTRPAAAIGGAALLQGLEGKSVVERDGLLSAELIAGNLPPFLRRFAPVRVTRAGASGKEHTLEYQVMPDYLSVGSDVDFARLPLTPMTAQRLADLWDCTLPTVRMVDDIYRQAAVSLEPRPLTQNRELACTFLQHHRLIEEQRAGKRLGELVAGTKKDVVITNRLRERPARVAIYGWHKPDGKPIQPLTTVHVDRYVDYSHGIRLVKREAKLDGRLVDLRDVLRDPELSPLVSDEGPITCVSYSNR
ncbi:MAG: hypothetical protein ACO1SX_27825 [Actinomycetota bacterium]